MNSIKEYYQARQDKFNQGLNDAFFGVKRDLVCTGVAYKQGYAQGLKMRQIEKTGDVSQSNQGIKRG